MSFSIAGQSGVPHTGFGSGGYSYDQKSGESSFEIGVGGPPGISGTVNQTFEPIN